jgi:hypothetical protein
VLKLKRFRTGLVLISVTLLSSSCIVQPHSKPPIPTTPPIFAPSSPPQVSLQDTTPPEIQISSSVKETTSENEITFKWTGNDNKTPSDKLVFSCYLEKYDTVYSPFTNETSRIYRNIPVGSYVFYIKSQDEASNNNLASVTIQITVAIVPPKEKDTQSPVTSSLLILSNSEVNRIAVSSYSNVIYALDSVNAKLYKSEQGGFGWTNIPGISGAATWDVLAIAPDDHNIIAISTDAGKEVYLSIDGGSNFFITQLTSRLNPGERIKCMTISPGYSNNTHEIMIGTSTNNGNGRVLNNKISRFPGGWQDCSTGVQGWLRTTSGVDVFSIRFSPSFSSDSTVIAVVASGPSAATGDTYLYIGIRDLSASSIIWNNFSGYPVEICQQGQDTPGTPLTYADLALPADYLGGTISQRHVYACWTDNPSGIVTSGNSNDDIYRLDDTMCYRLQVHPDIIGSLAHYGTFSRGKLLAGALKAEIKPSGPGIQVYFTSSPMSASPIWQQSQKPPTGTHNAQVAWSPDGKIAYCGTSTVGGVAHDQSSFSRSTNNSFTWNQIGLIDN